MLSKILLLQIIYWWSYVLLIFLICRGFRLLRKRRFLPVLLLLVFVYFFVRIRFREPQQIHVEEQVIDIGVDKKIVLIADVHLGVYKDRVYLQKVVNKINTLEDIDMVMIAGDFLYEPLESQSLEELFQPLGDLEVPIYVVLGNHDTKHSSKDLKHELVSALEKQGVHYLQNDIVQFDDFFLVWLGPHFAWEDDVRLLKNFHILHKVVVLTHNPDTTLNYNNYNVDLTLVGHTHCGQVRLPWIHDRLHPYLYPVEGDFDCGYYEDAYTRLFITPGLGEVLLPMRFRNSPTISVIDLQE